MLGAPLLSSFTALDLIWLGLPHTTKELRALKAHLDGGGAIHVQSTKDKVTLTAIVKGQLNVSQSRTSETGVILHVDLLPSNSLNDLEKRIVTSRQIFVSRTGEEHATLPTTQAYAFAPKTLSVVASDVKSAWYAGLLSEIFTKLYRGALNLTMTSTFYLLQGNILRVMWTYPVLQVPLVLASIALMMTYHNLTCWDVIGWTFRFIADGFSSGTNLAVGHFGEPAGWFISTLCGVYIFIISVCLVIWMSWRLTIKLLKGVFWNACNLLINAPLAAEKNAQSAVLSPGASSLGASSPSLIAPVSAPPMAPSVSATSTSVSDSSDSTPSAKSSKLPCQAHLIHLNSAEGAPLSHRACNGKHVPNIPLLSSDWLIQNGKSVSRW